MLPCLNKVYDDDDDDDEGKTRHLPLLDFNPKGKS